MQDSLDITIYCDHGHPDIKVAATSLKAHEADTVAISSRHDQLMEKISKKL